MQRTHWGQHDLDCYGCKLATIAFNPTEHFFSKKDRQWDTDIEAYRRLRKNGVQPKGIDGSAEIERKAGTVHEVESGQVLSTRKQRRQLQSLLGDMPT